MKKNAMSSGQARSIKITGDRIRKYFEKQCVNEYGQIKQKYLAGLTNQFADGTFILKSGNNWQFHLGSFYPYTENWGTQFLNNGKTISYNLSHEEIISDLRRHDFIRKFMLKGNFFCVYDTTNWLIFDSQDFISMLQDSDQVKWRILESGRIKGDIYIDTSKRTIFTLEYRAEWHKKQFVLGAHGGGAGERLKHILKNNFFFNSVPVDYGFWQ